MNKKIWKDQLILVEKFLKDVIRYQLDLTPKIIEIDLRGYGGEDVSQERNNLFKQRMTLRMEELTLKNQKQRLEDAINDGNCV